MNLLDLEPATTLHFCPGLKSPWTHCGQPWESDCWGKTPTNTSPNRFRWAGVLTTSAKQICMGEPNSKVYRKVMEDTENVFEDVWSSSLVRLETAIQAILFGWGAAGCWNEVWTVCMWSLWCQLYQIFKQAYPELPMQKIWTDEGFKMGLHFCQQLPLSS